MVDLTKLEKIQDYRFGSLMKGERYAYARGLTINPTHLPAALDAMAADGWMVRAVFGETDSDKIGFLFERQGPTAEEARLQDRVDGLLEANSGLVLANRELMAKVLGLKEQNDGLLKAEMRRLDDGK